VNAISVMASVQLEFGQSGAPGMGEVGGLVVTLNCALPFLIALAGIPTLPVTVTGAGFRPGAWFPPLFEQTAGGLAVAARLTCTSPNPSPASSLAEVRVRPLSVKAGTAWAPPFKWTLLANAVPMASTPRVSAANRDTRPRSRIRRRKLVCMWLLLPG